MRALSTLACLCLLTLAACDSAPVDPPGPVPDTTAPVVQLTFPAAGAMLTGVVTLRYTSTENPTVGSATYLVDGNPVNGSLGLNTAAYPDGTHTLAVQVRDDAGNVGTSPVINVQFVNDSPGLVMNSLVIDSPPFTDPTGTGWDVGSAPDVYAVLLDEADQRIATTTVIVNASPTAFPSAFPATTPIRLRLDKRYRMAVYDDDDATADQLMFFTSYFVPSAGVRARPPSVTLPGNPSGAGQLTLTWDAPGTTPPPAALGAVPHLLEHAAF